jgi:dolichol-phosphate mannosyltransferase
MDEKTISIVLPAHNEADNIVRQVEACLGVAGTLPVEAFEIIVVDDGSTDETAALVENLIKKGGQIRLIRHDTNRGYAEALKSGFSSARMRLIFYTDADNQFDIRELKNFLPAIEDYDIVSGFRIYRYDPLSRLILSWGFNLLVRIIFRIRLRDIDCAFKLFRREVFHKVTIRSKKFFVDAEILAKARFFRFRMTEIGVRHYPRTAGASTVRPSHIPRTLLELGKIWWHIYVRKCR